MKEFELEFGMMVPHSTLYMPWHFRLLCIIIPGMFTHLWPPVKEIASVHLPSHGDWGHKKAHTLGTGQEFTSCQEQICMKFSLKPLRLVLRESQGFSQVFATFLSYVLLLYPPPQPSVAPDGQGPWALTSLQSRTAYKRDLSGRFCAVTEPSLCSCSSFHSHFPLVTSLPWSRSEATEQFLLGATKSHLRPAFKLPFMGPMDLVLLPSIAFIKTDIYCLPTCVPPQLWLWVFKKYYSFFCMRFVYPTDYFICPFGYLTDFSKVHAQHWTSDFYFRPVLS